MAINLINILINVGLAISPFMFWPGADGRIPKEIFCLLLVVFIVLYAIYKDGIPNFSNPWYLGLLGFLIISVIFSPKLYDFMVVQFLSRDSFRPIVRGDQVENPLHSLWAYRPIFYCFIYSFFMFIVAGSFWTPDQQRLFLKIMAVCGLLTAVYMIFQHFGLDQWNRPVTVKENINIKEVPAAAVGGMFRNPTIASPFLVLTLPFTLYFRKYLWAAILIVAICLSMSKVAIVAMVLTLMVYIALKSFEHAFFMSIVAFCLITAVISYTKAYDPTVWPKLRHSFATESSGRTNVWKDTIKDIHSPAKAGTTRIHAITGFGPGTFYYWFSTKHSSSFFHAHNDPLEIWYNLGYMGIFLFGMSILFMLRRAFTCLCLRPVRALVASFIGIAFCSCGTFVWQNHALLFYSLVVVGLLHNIYVLKGED